MKLAQMKVYDRSLNHEDVLGEMDLQHLTKTMMQSKETTSKTHTHKKEESFGRGRSIHAKVHSLIHPLSLDLSLDLKTERNSNKSNNKETSSNNETSNKNEMSDARDTNDTNDTNGMEGDTEDVRTMHLQSIWARAAGQLTPPSCTQDGTEDCLQDTSNVVNKLYPSDPMPSDETLLKYVDQNYTKQALIAQGIDPESQEQRLELAKMDQVKRKTRETNMKKLTTKIENNKHMNRKLKMTKQEKVIYQQIQMEKLKMPARGKTTQPIDTTNTGNELTEYMLEIEKQRAFNEILQLKDFNILRKMTQSQTVKYHLIHFTSTTMKKYHDNRTPLVQKWPVLGRLLPMGFNWRICLLAVLTLKEQLPLTAIGEENALDDVQKLSDWILAHQKIEIHRMECYRKIYALAVKFGMITNVDSTGDRLVSMTMVTKDMIEKICVEKRSDPAYKELFFHSPSSLKPQNWNGQIKPHNWNPRMHPSSPAHREIDQNWGSFDKKDIPTNVVMSLGIACEELMPLAKRSMSDSAIEIDPSHLGK